MDQRPGSASAVKHANSNPHCYSLAIHRYSLATLSLGNTEHCNLSLVMVNDGFRLRRKTRGHLPWAVIQRHGVEYDERYFWD
jgi:hypothetical protein